MVKTTYINISEINDLQTKIMQFVDVWVHERKTLVPRSEIIKYMEKQGVNFPTVRASLYALLKKGYLRKSDKISNKTYFIQLRRVDEN